MRKLLLFLIFLPQALWSQDCSCTDQLNWLIKTFEENDAGFQLAIDQKGREAYEAHNAAFRERVKPIEKLPDCSVTLYQWTQFFRTGHVGIQLLEQPQVQAPAPAEIIEKYKNEPRVDIREEEFRRRMSQLSSSPGFEGVWQNGNYTIGVLKDALNPDRSYVGFILEADGVYWQKNQIKLEIFPGEKKGRFDARFYMRDHSERQFSNIRLLGNNYLQTGFVTWKRVTPELKGDPDVETYLEIIDAQGPLIRKISENTILLRVPSFDPGFRKEIDSLMAAHHALITSTPNLVIDLRNNGGGSDESFGSIIPYLYTNPIRVIGLEFLSTPFNNARMEGFIQEPDWSEEDKEWARVSLKKLNENLGKFVNLDTTDVSVEKLDTIYPYPKNVAVLINGGCGSTTEQFLLAAKQSKKVKLFGTTTFGSLDISNQNYVPFPCGKMNLVYSLSRSKRIPDFAIDERGIQPDFFLDDQIPDYKWIDYAVEILNR